MIIPAMDTHKPRPDHEPMTTLRQRLLACYRRQSGGEGLISFSLCPSLDAEFHRRYGAEAQVAEVFSFPSRSCPGPVLAQGAERFTAFLDADLRTRCTIDATWGIGFEQGLPGCFHMHRMHHPLAGEAGAALIRDWPWPDFASAPAGEAAAVVAEIHERGLAAVGSMACTIWETAWYLRSMEDLMMDMLQEPERAALLLDRVTDEACARAAHFARAGCDIIALGDDIGMQQGPMMAPELYREWLKPRLAKVIAAARTIAPEVIIYYHSCGDVRSFIDDLIEVGVDVLDPLQPESMAVDEVLARWGQAIAFHGGIGTQTTMPFASPDEVRSQAIEHRRLTRHHGASLFSCPTHLLEPEVPWDNIEAYVAAIREETS